MQRAKCSDVQSGLGTTPWLKAESHSPQGSKGGPRTSWNSQVPSRMTDGLSGSLWISPVRSQAREGIHRMLVWPLRQAGQATELGACDR